jgi:PIN domain nuclease of toxin-antitoxin system
MILLDTVALIRLGTNGQISESAIANIAKAENLNQVFVSAISAWELCLLEKRAMTGPKLVGDGALFFHRMIGSTNLNVIALDAQIVVESRRLPGNFHQDPCDRFIVATARIKNIPIMTADTAILDYGKLGHVQTIPC